MPIASASTGLHETLALLTSQLHPDANHKEDLVFLKDVLSEKSIVHFDICDLWRDFLLPTLSSLSLFQSDPCLRFCPWSFSCALLAQAVLSAHDTVAQKNFDPVLPPLPEDLDDDLEEESVKIVRLVKNKEPLGATIRRDEATGAVIVARIMRGGAADRSGLVHVGDELREVNGNLITHKRPDEISQILSQSQGSITLKIIPAVVEEDNLKESRVYLRALFDYTPFEDKATPCQEAGLPFQRGDILQVVSHEDATWWQAKRVGDCNLRAALIPSTLFQERVRCVHILRLLFILKRTLVSCCVSGSAICRSLFRLTFCTSLTTASLRRSLRLRRDRQGSPGEAHTPDANHADFLIYEEVAQYLPRPGERPRLIVLIGSLGARVTELKQKVIAENPRRYGLAVPHTTRARKSHEREGVEYHFITKAAFEADIQCGKFIEYGEYKDNLYGTSLESIHRVLDQNKVCLVDVQPEALKTLRTAEFKPYVFFVRPRIFDNQRKPLGSSSSLSLSVTEDELQDIKQSVERTLEGYGHWMDYVLVKEDPVSALAELQVVLERVQMEPQWVPVSWVRS
uniref:MAGUK p55 scaffold protein 3b n=1 Tax=Scophthalmus maximus TaxID=52904 RepID=A0A8D3CF34_SCOMX